MCIHRQPVYLNSNAHDKQGQLICLGDCVDVRASDGLLYKGILERIMVPGAEGDASAVCQVTWLIPNGPATGFGEPFNPRNCHMGALNVSWSLNQ